MDNRVIQKREKKKAITVLIVEDQRLNRLILREMLSPEYNVLEAGDGRQALEVLANNKGKVNAILLDLIMPVMDGYGFMEAIRETEAANLPIIVLTGEMNPDIENKVLMDGAWDYITKPYQPLILLSRLKNAIARSQMGMLRQIRHMAEHDALTGLYNREKFFSETRRIIDDYPDVTFAFLRIDIDQFSLINSFWGNSEGDRLINHMASAIKLVEDRFPVCTFGRINADVFCVCLPFDEDYLALIVEDAKNDLRSYNENYIIKATFGVYAVTNPEEPVAIMFEKASMAARQCKGRYNSYIGHYTQAMEDRLKWEQEIANQMQHALDDGQFIPWIQPKYHLSSEKPCGGEALVRWDHPSKGILSPGLFVPVFERNGFITKLDYNLWGRVCALLRGWKDKGYDPHPISVNISRIDMYNPNIVGLICGLTEKYGISAELLNLELTESAYMDNPDQMKRTVEELKERGFTILMDDFGSGYSSLNTLKEIPVDILKIDMNFLQDSGDGKRSEIILASTVSMADQMEMPVIVEGVETLEQAEFLKSIGCGYVQGYYYGRPMPVGQYQSLMEATWIKG